ncbi:aprataxin and PNK-like factor isoform X1 [Procambarus clarkii]|uniref:aprataxin and PNK-like factor isoform X1 n=1 Tax=Procambarus clarkii TaxID=6728 RepID=UPI0037428C34
MSATPGTVVGNRVQMSVALVRVKGPGKSDEEYSSEEIPVSLPLVLGRGSLLKCGEKGISRRHAYLDWDDDGVLITAVHQNATFVVANGREEELTVGSSALLTHGDTFGLMKTRFWYKISLPDAAAEDKNKTKEGLHIVDTEATGHVEIRENNENKSEVTLVIKKNENDIKETKVKDVSSDSVKNVEVQHTSPVQCNKQNSHHEPHPTQQDASVIGEKTLKKNDCTENHTCNDESVEPATVTLQAIQSAVSTRKRDLPAWMAKNDVTIDKGKQIEKGNLHPHGAGQKTHSTTSKRKTAVKNLPAFQANQNTGDKNEVSSRRPALTGSTAELGDAQGPRIKQNKANNCSPIRNKQSTTRKATSSPKKRSSPQTHRTKILHDMSDENSEQDTESIGQERDDSNTENPSKKNQLSKKHQLSPSKNHVVSDNEEDVINEASHSTDSVSTDAPLPTTSTLPSPALSQRKVPRETCQYGASCYRKNPKHRADFAHYGDSDYNENPSGSEDSDDDRPQCEFGVDCYRKNPQHRRDFRHSRVPQPQRKAKRKARRQKQDAESGSDEYDYDDPFLNDGSSDDYAPTESGSDSAMDADEADVEDTKRMLNEAKKFVKKK